MFKQNKKYIANFIIKFEVLAMKAETNNLYTIFLLNKSPPVPWHSISRNSSPPSITTFSSVSSTKLALTRKSLSSLQTIWFEEALNICGTIFFLRPSWLT